MDNLSPTDRRRAMRRVRGRDTTPELVVRRLLHAEGYRYRLHGRDLPGKPDIVFVARRRVIFVHGCFWHGHTCPRGSRRPGTRRDYWNAKLDRNAERDRSHARRLRRMGWGVMIVWECQTAPRRRPALERRLRRFLGPTRVT